MKRIRVGVMGQGRSGYDTHMRMPTLSSSTTPHASSHWTRVRRQVVAMEEAHRQNPDLV